MRLLTKISAFVCTIVAGIAGLGTAVRPNMYNYHNPKSNEQIVYDLKSFQGEDDIIVDMGTGYAKFMIPKDNEITVVVDKDSPERYFDCTVAATDKLNELFDVINPDINYKVYKEGENKEKADITVKPVSEANFIENLNLSMGDNSHMLAVATQNAARVVAYNAITDATIMVSPNGDSLNDRELSQCLLHEFGHTLGLADVYNRENCYKTIMFGYLHPRYEMKFYLKDAKALSAMYGKTKEFGRERFDKLFQNGDLLYDPETPTQSLDNESELGE